LLRCINGTIGADAPDSADPILGFDGKLLLVIDDFETFSATDKSKIEDFIKRLDINRHKVIITTRANIVIGIEFQSNELKEDSTLEFLLQVLGTEFPDFNLAQAQAQLTPGEVRALVQSTTSGRPLFIFQLAFIWAQKGTLRDALKRDIKQEANAIEFLYGRLFDYLSDNGKRLFVTISQLVTKQDPSNLVEKLQYVASLDGDDSGFQTALKELLKLKLIEVLEGKFFRVYSNEILQIMTTYFGSWSSGVRANIVQRISQVTRDKKLDNDHALLESANSARFSKSEEETVSQYRQILNRTSSPLEVKLTALLNLADYLFNHRGKKEDAIELIAEHHHFFKTDPSLAKVYANYLWSCSRKDEAISALSELFSRKPGFTGGEQQRIELTGLHVTYASITAIEKKDDLKSARRYGEIGEEEFIELNAGIKREMVRIFWVGWKLFDVVSRKNMEELNGACRQNVSTALVQLANIAMRLNKGREAIEICEMGIRCSRGLYPDTFRSKLAYIHRIMGVDAPSDWSTADH